METCIALVVNTALGGCNLWVGRRATAGEGKENPKKLSKDGYYWLAPGTSPSPPHADIYMSFFLCQRRRNRPDGRRFARTTLH